MLLDNAGIRFRYIGLYRPIKVIHTHFNLIQRNTNHPQFFGYPVYTKYQYPNKFLSFIALI